MRQKPTERNRNTLVAFWVARSCGAKKLNTTVSSVARSTTGRRPYLSAARQPTTMKAAKKNTAPSSSLRYSV